MVGVPGRSRACQTCRARRKGCDGQLPACSQCIKLGLNCGGYSRERVWVPAKQRAAGKVNATYSLPVHAADGFVETSIALHDSLARTAREEKYIGLYLGGFLPNGQQITPNESIVRAASWMAYVESLSASEKTFRYVMLATSTTILGSFDRNSQLRIKGLQTYGAALEELGRALKNHKRATSDGVLAAIRMMGNYEVFFGLDAQEFKTSLDRSQIDGWNGHTDGEYSLTTTRGPKGFSTGIGHELFANGRMNAVINGITTRKRSVLASHKWKTLPWSGRQKTLRDKFFDIAIDIPGLLEDTDEMNFSLDSSQREARRLELVRECHRIDQAFAEWEAAAASKIRRFDCTVAAMPFPKLVGVEDLTALHLSCVHWAICIHLRYAADALLKGLEPNSLDECKVALNELYIAPADIQARRIARSIHLFFEPQTGGLGPNLGFMPLVVALYYYHRRATDSGSPSEEMESLQGLLSRSFMGVIVQRFLENLQKSIRGW